MALEQPMRRPIQAYPRVVSEHTELSDLAHSKHEGAGKTSALLGNSTNELPRSHLLIEALARVIAHIDTFSNTTEPSQVQAAARSAAQEALRLVHHFVDGQSGDTVTIGALREDLQRLLLVTEEQAGLLSRLFVRGAGTLPTTVERAVLGIVREASKNSIQHAHARAIWVDLELEADRLSLTISDDGVGFAPEQITGGSETINRVGIAMMEELANSVGGTLRLSSWPGNGTRVTATLPIQQPRDRVPAPGAVQRLAPSVLIVDDHPVARQALIDRFRFTGSLTVVGEAADGQSALDIARRTRPAIVLLDLGLPGKHGLTVLRELREELPETRVIVLTASDRESDATDAVKLGAHGYVTKGVPFDELIAVVQRVTKGETVVAPRIIHEVSRRLTSAHIEAAGNEELSERELEVLHLLVQGKRNRDIAEVLVISEHTVKSHVGNIFAKLGVTDRASAISVAIRQNIGDVLKSLQRSNDRSRSSDGRSLHL